MKIALGSDHRGTILCEQLITQLQASGHQVMPLGHGGSESCDYPDRAVPVALAVAQGNADRGILVCGTGIGMCIAANKVPGIRAASVHDEVSARVARRHADANVLCLSGEMLSERMTDRIVAVFLETEFEGGRHARRIEKIASIEATHLAGRHDAA